MSSLPKQGFGISEMLEEGVWEVLLHANVRWTKMSLLFSSHVGVPKKGACCGSQLSCTV